MVGLSGCEARIGVGRQAARSVAQRSQLHLGAMGAFIGVIRAARQV
eukprot:COSAG05_NODE_16867_length_337_cov_0.491597_1_plen_45_part_10